MTEPIQTCRSCGDTEIVKPDGRGFPPDIAARRLIKRCRAKGCQGEPRYRAGVSVELLHRLEDLQTDDYGQIE